MSHTTNESDDSMYSSNHSESQAADNGSGCRSRWDGSVLKKGPWSTAEDEVLIDYVKKHGEGNWNAVQKHTGLSRCGKSCRLRWANHLRPNLKKGAFSEEEEQLIVELHAQMGNKWARMAAHLPGRTDNEIKNYWNTRIKRRQRAGLPLYPPEMNVEALQWNQEYPKSEILGLDKRHQDFLQAGDCASNVLFDTLKVAPDLSDMRACNMLGSDTSSCQYKSFMQPITRPPKRLLESDEYEDFQGIAAQKRCKSLSSSFPCDFDPPDSSQPSSSVTPGNHTLMDAIFPPSNPSFGSVKLELPSFQYPETNFDQWKTSSSPRSELFEPVDTYIQYPPPMGKAEPDLYPCDTGLLDMLLHEAKAKIKTSTKNTSLVSKKSSGSITSPEIQLGAGVSSSCRSPLPSDNNIAGNTIKLEQWDPIWTGEREQEVPPGLDMSRPDVLLASSWLDHGFGTSTMSDTLVALLGDAYSFSPPPSLSSVEEARAVGSCAWSNMPPVCQMTELP